MGVYNEAVSSSFNRELNRRYGGSDARGSITPLFPPDSPAEELPNNLTRLLTDDRYPLLAVLHDKVDPAIIIVDREFGDCTLEGRMNSLIGLLFNVGFKIDRTKGHHSTITDAAHKSLRALCKLLQLPIEQIISRRNAAIDDPRFEQLCDQMEKEYQTRLKSMKSTDTGSE